MSTPPIPVARLRPHLAALAGPPPTDADLLARFVADRDNDAFAELVRRHGPAVLAVCRRITRDREDADDAFQATFLALAKKAARVQPGTAVAGWLFGAGMRAARKVLTRSSRRRDREIALAELPDVPDRPAPAHDPETARAVLEEVARLSPAYRAAVVLCELEGRSRSAAAHELGIPEGTLSSRLAAARKVLARRLDDQGLAPAALAAVAGGVCCPVLAADAAQLAGAAHSPHVLKLSEEVMRTPVSSKWWSIPAAILIAAGIAAFASPPEDPKQPIRPVLADTTSAGDRLLLMRERELTILSPDGKKQLAVKVGWEDAVTARGWLSPDGKRVAYLVNFGFEERQPRVMVRDLDGGKFATSIDVNAMYLLWTPDGRSLVATSYVTELWEPLKTEHFRIDLVTKKASRLDWPDDITPVDWSADGKSLVIVRYGERPTGNLGLMTVEGKTVTKLIDLRDANHWSGVGRRLSPDGKKLLYCDAPPEGPDRHGMTRRLYVLDIATKKVTEVRDLPENATVLCACWSPDGKRIAYTWRQRHGDLVKEWSKKQVLDPPDVAVETETFLIVADADGSNTRTIASEKANNALEVPLLAIDWR